MINLFAPPLQLITEIPKTVSTTHLIDKWMEKGVSIPNISARGLPQLEGHIVQAKAHAREWKSRVRPGIVDTVNGVARFSDLFNNLFHILMKAVQTFSSDHDAGITLFRKLLEELHSETRQLAAMSHRGMHTAQVFYVNLESDFRNFAQDVKTAKVARKSAKAQRIQAKKTILRLIKERDEKQRNLRQMACLSPALASLKILIEELTGNIEKTKHWIEQAEIHDQEAEKNLSLISEIFNDLEAFSNITGDIASNTSGLIQGCVPAPQQPGHDYTSKLVIYDHVKTQIYQG